MALNPAKSFHSRKYSRQMLKNCAPLRAELADVATRHVCGDLLKSLLTIKRKEFILARNRMDIPFGMFGLSYDKFFERRRNNIVYLGIMEMVCKDLLGLAKYCIILDDLHDMVGRLVSGYHTHNMGPILEEFNKAEQLNTIHLVILEDYQKNQAELRKMMDQLRDFKDRESSAMLAMDALINSTLNRLRERQLISNTVELRYNTKFFEAKTCQKIFKKQAFIDEIQDELDHWTWLNKRDLLVVEYTLMKQNFDCKMIKKRIKEMGEQYDHDLDQLSGELAYKTNSIEIMTRLKEDYKVKMAFYLEDIVNLYEWDANRKAQEEDQRRAEAQKLFQKKKKRRK